MEEKRRHEAQAVLIYSGRNEFQVYLMILVTIVGFTTLYNAGSNPDLFQLPVWMHYVWGGGLIIGGLINLFASFFPWKDLKNGLVLESISCASLIATTIIYTMALLGFVEGSELNDFLLLDLLTIIAAIRLWRLVGYIRQINKLRNLANKAIDAAKFIVKGDE